MNDTKTPSVAPQRQLSQQRPRHSNNILRDDHVGISIWFRRQANKVIFYIIASGFLFWFIFYLVVGISSPKLATHFVSFCNEQNVTTSQKGPFVVRTDMLSAFYFAKKETKRSIRFAKNEKY